MTCPIFYTTEMPSQQAKVSGTPPRKPMRWAVEYVVKTSDGRTLVESTKTIQRATFEELRAIMDYTIGAIGDEAGNIASFVSWRATARGGVSRRRKGARR